MMSTQIQKISFKLNQSDYYLIEATCEMHHSIVTNLYVIIHIESENIKMHLYSNSNMIPASVP